MAPAQGLRLEIFLHFGRIDARRRKVTRESLPSATDESKALARDLKRRGFRFCGPTTVYAFMQAMGMVNDHLSGCRFRSRVEEARRSFRRPT